MELLPDYEVPLRREPVSALACGEEKGLAQQELSMIFRKVSSLKPSVV